MSQDDKDKTNCDERASSKRARLVGTGILLLLLGFHAPAFAQQEQRGQDGRDQKQERPQQHAQQQPQQQQQQQKAQQQQRIESQLRSI
jgi:hypothetical protein